jgi:DNA (cytosine-5)-methyltransferase 1
MGTFYEFFAGGGMARAGLGPDWTCLFANDFDPKKGVSYQANWGAGGELKICDVRTVTPRDLPGHADFVWGSFPCQDLSLAGAGAGLRGHRSGTFYPFWDVITGLVAEGRRPNLIAVENVCGTLTSHGGKDFEAICRTFAEAGYRYGALVINADLFMPQSRPRLFVVGVHEEIAIPSALSASGPSAKFHPAALRRAVEQIPDASREAFLGVSLCPERRIRARRRDAGTGCT